MVTKIEAAYAIDIEIGDEVADFPALRLLGLPMSDEIPMPEVREIKHSLLFYKVTGVIVSSDRCRVFVECDGEDYVCNANSKLWIRARVVIDASRYPHKCLKCG